MADYSAEASLIILCYYCHTYAVVAMGRQWRKVDLAGAGDEVPISFVSCAACLTLPGVHNPTTASFRRYVNPKAATYSEVMEYLRLFCLPIVQEQRRLLALPSFKFKTFARVRDISEILYVSSVPHEKIVIRSGQTLLNDCGFFKSKPLILTRASAISPHTKPSGDELLRLDSKCLQHPDPKPPAYESESSYIRYVTSSDMKSRAKYARLGLSKEGVFEE